jgi:hypothetical protein
MGSAQRGRSDEVCPKKIVLLLPNPPHHPGIPRRRNPFPPPPSSHTEARCHLGAEELGRFSSDLPRPTPPPPSAAAAGVAWRGRDSFCW